MAFERKWAAVAAKNLTQNGNPFGLVTLASTAGFYVKQKVQLASLSQPQQQFQIKWVLDGTKLILGAIDNKVGKNLGVDLSRFTLNDSATLSAVEQDKNSIPEKDHYSAVYEADPVVADRVILVDEDGERFSNANPVPVSLAGSLSVGDVTVRGTNTNALQPNSDGSLNVILNGASAVTTITNVYGSASAVSSGGTATIATYTIPTSMTANLQKVSVSGENFAKYFVKVNGTTVEVQRTSGVLNTEFDFMTGQAYGGYPLVAADVITVVVLNISPSNSVADFDARIQVSKTPA